MKVKYNCVASFNILYTLAVNKYIKAQVHTQFSTQQSFNIKVLDKFQ